MSSSAPGSVGIRSAAGPMASGLTMPGTVQYGAQCLFSSALHRGPKVSPVTSKAIIRSIIAFVLIVAPPAFLQQEAMPW